MDEEAFRKVQAQFATMFAGSAAGLVDEAELDPDAAPPPMPSLAALEASLSARTSAAAARTGRAEHMNSTKSIVTPPPATTTTTSAASLSWRCQSRLTGGTMTLSTLGRNQLAGSVAGSLGLAALPQPAPSSTGSPSLLVCPIDSEGTLSGSGVPLVPSKVSSSATVTAMAWSESVGRSQDGLLAAAWGGGTKASASEYTLQVWRVSRAPSGTGGAPLRVHLACRRTSREAIKSLAWSGTRLAVCCPSSIRILEVGSCGVDGAATSELADTSLLDLPPSSSNKWSECQFVATDADNDGSVLVGMSRSDVSFFVCSADFWRETVASAKVGMPDRPQPRRLSVNRREMGRFSTQDLGSAGGCGELRTLHVLPRTQAADNGKVIVQLVVTSDSTVAITEPAQISVASTCRDSHSAISSSSLLISDVPVSPSSDVVAPGSQAGDGPLDLIGKLGSGAAATRVVGGDDNEAGPSIPAFLMLGSSEAEEAAATQSFAALLNKDAGSGAGLASSSARLVTLLAAADDSRGDAHATVPTIEVGSALALPELGACIPDLLACDETTGTLMVGSSHDKSCRLHSVAVVQQLQGAAAEKTLAQLQPTGVTLEVAERGNHGQSNAEDKERLKGVTCFALANGRQGLLVLIAKSVNTRRESAEAIKEATAKAIMRGGLSGGERSAAGLQALALSSAAVAQYSTVFLAFTPGAAARVVRPVATAASTEPESATGRRQQRSPSPTGSFGLPSSPLSEEDNPDLSSLSTGGGGRETSTLRHGDPLKHRETVRHRAAVAEWSTAAVGQWLVSPAPDGPGCAAAVAAAAERASFDGAALLELHALWTGTATATGADVSSGRVFAMDILREELGLTRVGEQLRVFQRLRAAVGE